MLSRTLIKELPARLDQEVNIFGWIHTIRDHKKIVFLDIRDYTGHVQTIVAGNDEQLAAAKAAREESVVEIRGIIQKRPDKLVNENQANGNLEVAVQELKVINQAKMLPFELGETKDVNEDLRLEYRYLDLRSERLQRNLRLRSQINNFVRNYLNDQGFVEIETPSLSKSTPEGARDFLVPSRKYKGSFYALPQSPQQYKQLLMVGGLERYFQIARCFRDEDQRGQRQPEFTQLDLEMSFVEQEDIISLVEKMMMALVKEVTPHKKISTTPFVRLTHAEAKEKYNTDTPDLRTNKDDPNELAFCWITDFPMFEYKEGDKRWAAEHNPFTMPKEEHWEIIREVASGQADQAKLGEVRAIQYDLSLNGNEIFGGAVRNHLPDLLQDVFMAIGHSEQEVKEQFGHLLKAFTFGVPPHAGIASGHDRLVMILANEPNIREVIAFPKNGEAYDPMMKSPSEVSRAQLKELGLTLSKQDDQT